MDDKDHSFLRDQDARFEAKQKSTPEPIVREDAETKTETQEPVVEPKVEAQPKSKSTIPTRLGTLIILLAAMMAGAACWWSGFSY